MTMSPKFDLERKIKQDLMDMGVVILSNSSSITICDDDFADKYRLPKLRLPMTIDQARSLGVTLLDLVFKAKGVR